MNYSKMSNRCPTLASGLQGESPSARAGPEAGEDEDDC